MRIYQTLVSIGFIQGPAVLTPHAILVANAFMWLANTLIQSIYLYKLRPFRHWTAYF
jgi:hypothetical protein